MIQSGHIMPSRWAPSDFVTELNGIGALSGFGAGTWPAANRAIYVPVQFPADCTVYGIHAAGANTTGNYDLGLYGPDLTLYTNKGSTAMAAALLSHTFSDIRVYGGLTYYMALALSSASGSVARITTGATIKLTYVGIAQQASAVPLPSTMTPATPASDYIPFLALQLR